MLRPEVDWILCQGCDPCTARPTCQTRAILQIDPGDPVYIELSRCNGCAKCVPACTFGAITMVNGTPPGGRDRGCAGGGGR